MALLRDIPFSQFGTNNTVQMAAGNMPAGFSLLSLIFSRDLRVVPFLSAAKN